MNVRKNSLHNATQTSKCRESKHTEKKNMVEGALTYIVSTQSSISSGSLKKIEKYLYMVLNVCNIKNEYIRDIQILAINTCISFRIILNKCKDKQILMLII